MTLVDDLNREYSWTPYASLANLMAARFQVDANELDKAAASLKSVMDSAPDNELQLIARTRLARVQAAQGKYEDALATLKVAQPGEFAPRLADARGDVLLAKGDRAGALREYLAARSGEADGRIDTELLDLKIRDLGGTPPPSAENSGAEAS
jgi:predicted negative regulator of RcsB-dependent stress response